MSILFAGVFSWKSLQILGKIGGNQELMQISWFGVSWFPQCFLQNMGFPPCFLESSSMWPPSEPFGPRGGLVNPEVDRVSFFFFFF